MPPLPPVVKSPPSSGVVVGSLAVGVVVVVVVSVEVVLVDVSVDVVGSVEVDVDEDVELLVDVVGSVVVDEVVSSFPPPPASANTAMSRPMTSATSRPIAVF